MVLPADILLTVAAFLLFKNAAVWLAETFRPSGLGTDRMSARNRERQLGGGLSAIGFLMMAAGAAGMILKHAVVSALPIVVFCQTFAIVLMIWARLTLGRRSFHVTAAPTEGGLVTTGPYRFVRHPIYASVCLFTCASSLAHASIFTVGMAVLLTVGAALRIAAEERALRERHPAHAAYANRTSRLAPFVPWTRDLLRQHERLHRTVPDGDLGPRATTGHRPFSARCRPKVPFSLHTRLARTSRAAAGLGLAALLAVPGCTAMVIDRFEDGKMAETLYFQLLDHEQPEVRVAWTHRDPADVAKSLVRVWDSEESLSIEPGLDGCQFYEVFVNGQQLRMGEGNSPPTSVPAFGGEVVSPNVPYPDCSVILTFRTVAAPSTFRITAATRNGVVAEFADGERRPAWLLLLPFAAIPDAVAMYALAGVFALMVL